MSNQTEPSLTERLKHLRYPATYGHVKLVNASKWAAEEIERLTAELEHARAEARAMHSAYETSVRLRALRRSWFKSSNDEPNLQDEVLRYFDEQPD